MPFIKFENVGIRSYEPAVSIYKNFVIGFNQPLTKEHELYKFTHAILYFNSDTSEIGIKFLDKEDVYSYKLHFDRSTISIGCKAFLKHYNIQYPQKKISNIRFEKDMLIIKVKINSGD